MRSASNVGLLLRLAFAADRYHVPKAFAELLERLTVSPEPAAGALDEARFKAELTALVPALRAYGRSISRSDDLADDLAQETILKAWAARERYRPGTNLKAWTFTIMRNLFLSQMRRKRFTAAWDERVADMKLVTPADQDRRINVEDAQRALAKLPEGQRQALLLVGAEDLSYEEVAETCDIAVGTVKSRVARGRAALQRLLDEPDGSIAA